ncbi:MAG: LysM peptidoglycan-binding domain-containing protein, partial [Burkholderiales bacterium]|nr:LysM peptidoglycan-binding domain-containing protein [Burkholderiales bacterium]
MRGSRLMQALACATTALLLVACASPPHRAPVEDRAMPGRSVPPPPTAEAKPLPGAENAGKPGYYTVKPGDTLIRIGLENGQNWRDIVRWNNLDNPNVIETGQVLRVV